MSFIQLADSSFRTHVHFHTVALDGAYVRDAEGELAFHALAEPSAEEVAQGAAWTHAALVRVLQRHGRSLEGVQDAPDTLRREEPVLASCYAASAADLQLLGSPRVRGRRSSSVLSASSPRSLSPWPRSAR